MIHRHLNTKILITSLACIFYGMHAHALEGGSTSDSYQWSSSLKNRPVNESERKAELSAREKAIQADIKRLNQRLTRTPSATDTAKLHKRLKEVMAQNGWVPEIQMVFGTRDTLPLIANDETLPTNFVDCILQLKKDLKARGADMIFMPLPPTPVIYSHHLVDGIDATHEYYPGYTKMLLQLLEADIEVIDPLEEFRAASKDNLLVNFANDFHTGDGGRIIAANMLNERLQRYGFIRELQKGSQPWGMSTSTTNVSHTRISVVNSKQKDASGRQMTQTKPNAPAKLKSRRFEYISKVNVPKGKEHLITDLVLIGDSQLHSPVYGAGWPDIAMGQIQAGVRWGSRSGGIYSSLAPIYLEVVPDFAEQPRVVVITTLTKYFWGDEVSKPRAMPPRGAVNKDGIPKDRFACTIEFTALSTRPTDDANALDYDHAFINHAAKIVDGPETMIGKEISLRLKILHKGKWEQAAVDKPQVGKQFKVRLWPEEAALKRNAGRVKKFKTMELFDTVEQDLLIPIFYMDTGNFGWNF